MRMIFASLILATLTTTAEVNTSLLEFSEVGRSFSLTGTVSSALFNSHFIIADATGRTHVRNKSATMTAQGDRVALIGYTSIDSYGQEQAIATNVTVLGSAPVEPPRAESVPRIARGEANYANVEVEGTVAGCFPDDIDSNWNYLILKAEGSFTYVSVPNVDRGARRIEDFSRAVVSVRGTVIHGHCGARRVIGPHIETASFNDVRLLHPPAAGGNATVSALNLLTPEEVVSLGPQGIEGRVVARWGERHLLISDAFGDIHRVDLLPELDLPAVGRRIHAVGQPETDLYRINLSKARYDTLEANEETADPEAPQTSPFDESPALRHVHFHGRTVRVAGRIRAEPTARSGWRAILETDRHERLSVDISTLTDLAQNLGVGTLVDLSGCGLIETDNWQPGAPFPQQNDLVLVLRSPDDLRVVSRPPWWTTGRLLAVIGALTGLLIAVFFWNRALNRLSDRRGRQLYREALAHADAEFRTVERTRLAAEMHDSLSQSLTGISCQIDAMEGARIKRPERLPHHLGLARRMLDGCRMQLRNCLWDLRNEVLNDPNAAHAIEQTVLPHAGLSRLTVAFPISRTLFSDTTFHEILCILRELVANAVRHGQAANIAIDAQKEDDRIVISVSDDGCGFDPNNCPGCDEGHFGLLGVNERLVRLGSTLAISSAPGRGTTCTFILDTKHE